MCNLTNHERKEGNIEENDGKYFKIELTLSEV